MPRVAAVIPTYNRKKLLLECLDALMRQTVPVDRIILVDNAGTDGSMDAVRERYPGHPSIEFHALERNTGAAMGFHFAVEAALRGDFDWIWFTDDDSEPVDDSLERLLEADTHLHADGRNPVVLASLKIDTLGRIQSNHNGTFSWRQAPIPPARCHGIVPIQYGAYTGLLVRREAIESQGTLRGDYFIWGDDVELCLRLARAGDLFLVSDSRVLHKDFIGDPKDRFTLGNFWRYYFGMRNWVHTARIHRGNWTVPLVFAACLYRILTIWTGMDRKVLRSRLMLRAFADGLRGDFSNDFTPDRWKAMIGGETYDPAARK